MEEKYLFTSESVTEGHPDKLCDMISDAVLDAYLKGDSASRVACEVTATTGIITVMGEITSRAEVDVKKIVRDTVREIGYTGPDFGFDADTCAVSVMLDRQSPDIDMGVSSSAEYGGEQSGDEKLRIGAGDQGMMFGYAADETPNLMPAPIYYAHKLSKRLAQVRKEDIVKGLGPDGKSMVTFQYENGRPVRITAIVLSTQHLPGVSQEQLAENLKQHVIADAIPAELLDEATKVFINPTGRFVYGGPCADTGLTGRKIIVDTYGGFGRHGGGAFSGKDPTKVDRTGAYAARYIAKNIVAAGIARRCEIQVAYAIGVAQPVSISVNTFSTSIVPEVEIGEMVSALFDLRPAALIDQFDLQKPIFGKLGAYGHLGRESLGVKWEATDKKDEIRQYFGL